MYIYILRTSELRTPPLTQVGRLAKARRASRAFEPTFQFTGVGSLRDHAHRISENYIECATTVEPLYYGPLNYGRLTVYKLDSELQTPSYSVLRTAPNGCYY